jgi:hypothetical protein
MKRAGLTALGLTVLGLTALGLTALGLTVSTLPLLGGRTIKLRLIHCQPV